jgi:RNA polymerase sigma factor (sigma-70 family)
VWKEERWEEAGARGTPRAGSRLVDRFVRPTARFFVNKVADSQDVDDLVSDTLEICARRLGSFEGRGTFRAYLFGIAHNVLRNYVRSRVRNGAEIDPEVDAIAFLGPSPVTALAQAREHRLLLRALRSVPLQLQIVLELAHFEQMSRREIAETLGLPAGTVATRLRTANALLERQLEALTDHTDLARSTAHGISTWASELRARIDARPTPEGGR